MVLRAIRVIGHSIELIRNVYNENEILNVTTCPILHEHTADTLMTHWGHTEDTLIHVKQLP